MKLDFSALAQPGAKTRGQVGTGGTPASTRVCESPLTQTGAGTSGDKPAAVVLVADLVVAAPAACPPVSPTCPRVTDAEKLNAGAVSPVSPPVPVEAWQSAAAADRHHKLKKDEADRCHAPCWNDVEIAAFIARTERFALLGRQDAEDLAERLTLRDRDLDDRRLCLECTWLGDTGRCLAAAAGRMAGTVRRLTPVQTILWRCDGFGLRKGLV